jgi:glycosyltransferase involved in cell wall biosynthesis
LSKLSIIAPVLDEEAVLPHFLARLRATLAELNCEAEILFVDDGSQDGSLAYLRQAAAEDGRIKVLRLTRNFGHQAALAAGLDHCSGDAAVLMDADLQDPPELIRPFVEEWRKGFQVVFGRRLRLEEGAFKRWVYHLFYRALRFLANIEIPMDSGDFSLLDREVVDRLRAMPERTRFLRGMRSWVGLRQTGITYERPARHSGRSKYSLAKLFKLGFDGILSFSTLPLKLALFLGLLVSAGGFVGIALVVLLRLSQWIELPWGWASTVVLVMFLGGVQLTTIGIVGEYIARIYEEVKARPLYLVAERIGFADAAGSAQRMTAPVPLSHGRDARVDATGP